jgi:hypothetical protein
VGTRDGTTDGGSLSKDYGISLGFAQGNMNIWMAFDLGTSWVRPMAPRMELCLELCPSGKPKDIYLAKRMAYQRV